MSIFSLCYSQQKILFFHLSIAHLVVKATQKRNVNYHGMCVCMGLEKFKYIWCVRVWRILMALLMDENFKREHEHEWEKILFSSVRRRNGSVRERERMGCECTCFYKIYFIFVSYYVIFNFYQRKKSTLSYVGMKWEKNSHPTSTARLLISCMCRKFIKY